jgi:hypothetical protein
MCRSAQPILPRIFDKPAFRPWARSICLAGHSTQSAASTEMCGGRPRTQAGYLSTAAATAVFFGRVGLSRHNLNLETTTMTDDKIALRELLEKGSDATFLRKMIGFAAERLMALETHGLCGAGHGECSPGQNNHRNGFRDRDWETRAADPSAATTHRNSGHPAVAERGGKARGGVSGRWRRARARPGMSVSPLRCC